MIKSLILRTDSKWGDRNLVIDTFYSYDFINIYIFAVTKI